MALARRLPWGVPERRQPGFVPIALEELARVTGEARELEGAIGTERDAIERLLELTTDLRAEAARRLRERGASAAQVERLEASYRSAVQALREAAAEAERRAANLLEHLDELGD